MSRSLGLTLSLSFNRDREVAAKELASAVRSSAFMRFRVPSYIKKTA